MKRAFVVAILLGLVFFGALSTGFDLYFRFAYVLALALLVGFLWAWVSLRWLEVEVQRRTTRAQVGGYVEERIRVKNLASLPKPWLEVEEMTDLPGHQTGQVISLRGSAFRSWRVRTLCLKRGVYYCGPIRVVGSDPLGLFRLERHFCGRQKVVIYPAIQELPHFPLLMASLPGEGRLYVRTHQATPLASSVREYMYGDGMNRIHWLTTARLGRLMVKEFDLGLSSNLWLLLDLHRDVQAGTGIETTDELAVTIAASVAYRLARMGMAVGLAAYGDQRYFLPPDRGYPQLERLLEYLARARAEGSLPLEQAVQELDKHLSRYNTLLVITPSSRGEWAGALAELSRRGVRVTVVLIDSSSYGGASPSAVLEQLIAHNITTFIVRKGQPLAEALRMPLNGVWTGGAPLLVGGRR